MHDGRSVPTAPAFSGWRARPVYEEIESVSRGECSYYTRLLLPVVNDEISVVRIYNSVRPFGDTGSEFEEVAR